MEKRYQVCFIGFGEAAFNISFGLHNDGLNEMIAYDIMQNDSINGELIKTRAARSGVTLASSLEEAYSSAKIVISLTSPAVCVQVAKEIIPNLEAGQVFADLNSAAPTDMTIIDSLPRKDGVLFCDVAVLGSVPKDKHRTKMYLCGDGKQIFYDTMIKYNTSLTILDAPAGGASAIKMFKSVFSKGFPQLILECYVPAAAYGVLDQIIDLTKDTFKERNIEEFTNENLFRTLIHAERRSVEAGDAARTVELLGFDASICRATQTKLQQLAKYDFKSKIGSDGNPDLRQVISMCLKETRIKK